MSRRVFLSVKQVSSRTDHSGTPADTRLRSGFSLTEVVLAGALLLLFITPFAAAVVAGYEETVSAGTHARAVLYAEEGLEAARAIRDADGFQGLSDGTYGLAVQGNRWIFSGSSDQANGMTRTITLSSIDADTKTADATVTWQRSRTHSGSVAAQTRLTNWKAVSANQSDGFSIDISGASLSGDNKSLRGIVISNNGTANATIATITVSWTKPSRSIELIRIGTDTVWSKNGPGSPLGVQDTGTRLDTQDYSLAPNTSASMDNTKFTGPMNGSTITILFEFTDGSTKSIDVNV